MEAKPSGELARVLGAKDAAAIMISNMVGTGILTLPGLIALSFGTTPFVLLAWTLGGLLSLAGALVQAELGCRYPLAGGDYVFLRAAYGELPAFLSGWTSFAIGFPGAIALAGLAAAQCLLDLGAWDVSRTHEVALAAGILVAISLVHSAGLRVGSLFQNALTGVKIAILLAIVAAGWAVFEPRSGDVVREAVPLAGFRLPSWWVAALLILFTYSGWNAAAYVAGEIRDPRRNLPRALACGVILVTALYLLVNWTYVRVVPPESLGGINLPGEVAREVFGAAGKRVVSAVLLCVYAGTASAMVLTGPRIYYAMARDRLLPSALTAVGSSSRAPVRSLWVQTVWSVGILVAGLLLTPPGKALRDTFEMVASWTTFAILPFAALTTSSVFVFRARDRGRGSDPTWRSPGYPWTALAFVGAASAVTAFAFATNSPEYQLRGAVGFALVGAGVPVYLLWKSLARRARYSA